MNNKYGLCDFAVGISFVAQSMASFHDCFIRVFEKNTYYLSVEEKHHVHRRNVVYVSKIDKAVPQKLMFLCLHVRQASFP